MFNPLCIYIFAEGERVDLNNLTSALTCARAFNTAGVHISILVNGEPIEFAELERWYYILTPSDQPISDAINKHLNK